MSVTLLCLRALKGSGQARQVVAFSADFAAATAFSRLILCKSLNTCVRHFLFSILLFGHMISSM